MSHGQKGSKPDNNSTEDHYYLEIKTGHSQADADKEMYNTDINYQDMPSPSNPNNNPKSIEEERRSVKIVEPEDNCSEANEKAKYLSRFSRNIHSVYGVMLILFGLIDFLFDMSQTKQPYFHGAGSVLGLPCMIIGLLYLIGSRLVSFVLLLVSLLLEVLVLLVAIPASFALIVETKYLATTSTGIIYSFWIIVTDGMLLIFILLHLMYTYLDFFSCKCVQGCHVCIRDRCLPCCVPKPDLLLGLTERPIKMRKKRVSLATPPDKPTSVCRESTMSVYDIPTIPDNLQQDSTSDGEIYASPDTQDKRQNSKVPMTTTDDYYDNLAMES